MTLLAHMVVRSFPYFCKYCLAIASFPQISHPRRFGLKQSQFHAPPDLLSPLIGQSPAGNYVEIVLGVQGNPFVVSLPHHR